MSGYVLISRCLSAIFSTITVILVYKLARKITGETGAIMAAALLAVSPLACRDAHFGVTDCLLTLCGTGCIYMLAGYLETGKAKLLAIASIIFGLALAAKYSAATIFPVLFLVVLFNNNVRGALSKSKHLAMAAIVPILVFLLFNPYIIPESKSFLSSMGVTVGTLYYNQQSSLPLTVIITQALIPLKYGPAGLICIPLLLISMFYKSKDMANNRYKWLVVVAFIFAILPIISTKHNMPYRYVLPALPYAAILAALAMEVIAAKFGKEIRKFAFAGLAVIALAPTLMSCVWTDILLSRTDSRTLAGEWISKNVGTEVPIVIVGWPECEPQVPETEASINRRIDFVRRLYGESAVPIVAQPYYTQLRSDIDRKGSGYELYRIAVPYSVPGRKICLVIPTYPYTPSALRTDQIQSMLSRYPGRITRRTNIVTLHKESAKHDFDPWDAFYIPVDNLSNIMRPGPSMNIYLIDRDLRKAK
jgi:hypothetical protein